MTTAAAGLRELHQLHVELGGVQEELDDGPKRVQFRAQFVERKLSEIEVQKEQVHGCRKAADERGLQLKTNEGSISELRSKLNTSSSNREFDIIKGQIDADVVANSVLEDEILDLLERVDQAQQVVAVLEEEHESAAGEQQRVTTEVSDAEPGLLERRERLSAAIAETEKQLPDDISDSYRRLVSAYGAGAMAIVENDACSLCFVGLSPQIRVELGMGRIVACGNCGRLLYCSDVDASD